MTITDKQCYQVASATTLTGAVTCNVGDYVIASFTTRSATTYPSGWTVLYESGVFETVDNQRMAILYKVATAITESFIGTQSTSGRIYINLISISGIGGVSYSGLSISSASAVTSLIAPSKTPGAMLIWACSASLWVTSGHWTTSPSDLALVDIGTSLPARQANFIDDGLGAATGRTFLPYAGAGSPCVAAAITLFPPGYKTSGNAIFAVTGITSTVTASSISWAESKPDGTTLTVSASIDGTNYSAVTNGGALLADGTILDNATIYIKVEMSTTDATVTPTLSGIAISLQSTADLNSIVLEMQPLERFESAAGNITVAYAGGSLMGEGGAVAAFTQTFSPSDLAYKGDQNDAEHIEMNVSAAGTLTRIFYTNTVPQDMGHIEMSVTATGTLTNVSDL